ncbi:MAG TPA: hypothetical protein VEA16_04490 [Vicinamibacterales bacterium]|nr:hypothetical protein [Vicinamibacterales bacterium]
MLIAALFVVGLASTSAAQSEVARATKTAQSGLAGKWTGTDQNDHSVVLELAVNGEEATGTLAIGPDPVKTLANGNVQGTTVTFTTPVMMNGRESTVTWRGELKDDRLTFTRRMGPSLEMSPVSLQRAAQ